MGFNFRKSVGVGPFRLNISKSGIGYSVGTKGFRTGVSSKGRKYSTFSLPGTGVSYSTSSKDKVLGGVLEKVGGAAGAKGRPGCAGVLLLIGGGVLLLGVARAWSAWCA